MVAETTDADEWSVQYDGTFSRKERCGDDTITVDYPLDVPEARDEFEIVGRIGDEIYHYTCADTYEAVNRVAVLKELADFEAPFEAHDEVFVVSADFEPVVQRGVVVCNNEQHRSVRVHFDSDPYGGSEHRTRSASDLPQYCLADGSTDIDVDPDEMLHVDANTVETLLFFGREDLLEPEDFGGVGE